MRIVGVALGALLVAGCVGQVDGDPAVENADEAIAATRPRAAPIPFVLQYVGAYEGTGRIASLVLDRSGKLTARIDERVRRGSFIGPTHVPETIRPPALVLVTGGERLAAQIDADAAWKPTDTIDVTIDGVTERLTATWRSGTESMCDATGGRWTDDDADPATGLYCVCASGKSFIPSLGGCVR